MSAAAVLDDYLDGLLAGTPAASPAASPGPAPAPAAAPAVAAPVEAHAAAPAPAPVAPEPEPAPVPVAPAASTSPAPPPAAPVARVAPAAPASFAPRAPAPVARPALPPSHGPAGHHGEEPPAPRREPTPRWLRLRCGGQRYGLELLKVQEVVLPAPLLALRGTVPAMLGVMNLRGQVVPVMDLGMHLGQPSQPETPATRFVVIEEKGEVLGLRVTAVEDVVTLGEGQVEPPGTTQVRRPVDGLFRGIARLGGDPMILLDASCLLEPGAIGGQR